MNKHTSGPWWQGNAFGRPTSDGTTVYSSATASGRETSVLVATGYAGEAAAVANTRLAAAAPEMLEALQVCAAELAEIANFAPQTSDPNFALNVARAAIAKATGEGE